MANSDSILVLNGGGVATPARNLLASQTGLGTVETLITMGTDAGTNVTAFMPFVGQTDIVGRSNPMSINANAAILTDQYGAKAGERGVGAPYFNTSTFDGRAFRLRIQGRFLSSAASNSLTVKFYQNTKANGPVTGTGNVIGSIATTATIGNAVSGSFIAEAVGQWDSVSGNMMGAEAWAAAAGAYGARAAGQSTPFAVASPLSNSLMFVTIKFATGAANSITPIEFAFEDI
jgi:hypothetical protein